MHVWSVPLDAPEPLDAHRALLDRTELERASRFVTDDLRRRFIVARSTLRRILGTYTGTPPEALEFADGPHGKPSLRGGSGLEFNVSHSGELAVVAVSRHHAVGIDVERLREVRDADAIAARFFSDAEQAQFRALAPDDRAHGFFRCWTRKEAFIKATGQGLSRPLGSFDVTLARHEPARLTRIHGDDGSPDTWTLHAFEPAAGYTGAVAVRHPGATFSIRHVNTLRF